MLLDMFSLIDDIDGLAHYCSNPSALTVELPQSCTSHRYYANSQRNFTGDFATHELFRRGHKTGAVFYVWLGNVSAIKRLVKTLISRR